MPQGMQLQMLADQNKMPQEFHQQAAKRNQSTGQHKLDMIKITHGNRLLLIVP
jgi:hypothetical protein